MKKHPNLTIGTILVVALILASIQSARVTHINDSAAFFGWIQAAATQVRLFGSISTDDPAYVEERGLKDEDLWTELRSRAEPLLPDISPSLDEDFDEDGNPHPKLILAANRKEYEEEIWQLASGRALAQTRSSFIDYLAENRLASAGERFQAEQMYSHEFADVSLGNLLFGFRLMAANLVWLQVDKYWHQGMVHRMLPLMRTCVALDPHFIDAYRVGAWHLAYNITAGMDPTPVHLQRYYPRYDAVLGEIEYYYQLGIDFLKDGIRKNPRNYKLYFDLGYAIYELKLNDHANAVKYLSEAIRHQHDQWVRRMLYHSLMKNGQYEESIAGWRSYIDAFPGTTAATVTAPRFITINKGLMAEERARQADVYSQRDAYYEEAKSIWNGLLAIDPDDNFAKARLHYIEALEMLDQQRYLEAIALLENARWQHNDFFYEFSDLIIDIKLEADIQLTRSEMKAYIRQQQEAEHLERIRAEAGA